MNPSTINSASELGIKPPISQPQHSQYIVNGSPLLFWPQTAAFPLEHMYWLQSESLLQVAFGGGVLRGFAVVVGDGGGGFAVVVGGGGGAVVVAVQLAQVNYTAK